MADDPPRSGRQGLKKRESRDKKYRDNAQNGVIYRSENFSGMGRKSKVSGKNQGSEGLVKKNDTLTYVYMEKHAHKQALNSLQHVHLGLASNKLNHPASCSPRIQRPIPPH